MIWTTCFWLSSLRHLMLVVLIFTSCEDALRRHKRHFLAKPQYDPFYTLQTNILRPGPDMLRPRSVGSVSTGEHIKNFQKIDLHFGDQTAKLNGEHNSLWLLLRWNYSIDCSQQSFPILLEITMRDLFYTLRYSTVLTVLTLQFSPVKSIFSCVWNSDKQIMCFHILYLI